MADTTTHTSTAVIELPPDPKLDGWPRPVGWLDYTVRNLFYSDVGMSGWVVVGMNCYQRRRYRAY